MQNDILVQIIPRTVFVKMEHIQALTFIKTKFYFIFNFFHQ